MAERLAETSVPHLPGRASLSASASRPPACARSCLSARGSCSDTPRRPGRGVKVGRPGFAQRKYAAVDSPGAAWIPLTRGSTALSGPARDRALRGGGARGLPALHVDRRRRHPAIAPSELDGRSGRGLDRRRRGRPHQGRPHAGGGCASGCATSRAPRGVGASRSTGARCPTSSRSAATWSSTAPGERRVRRQPGLDDHEVPVEVRAKTPSTGVL